MTVVGTGTKASGVLMCKRVEIDHRGQGCDDILTAAGFECRMMLGGSGVMTNALKPVTAKKRRKSYFDSTSDLFFHICIKTVIILVQV